MENKEKKSTKYMNKNQLIDSYIEGDIETVDLLEQIKTKMNDKKSGKNKNAANNMKRLSELFKASKSRKINSHNNQQILEEEKNLLFSESPKLNRTGLINLKDFLADIDDENTPISLKPQTNIKVI